MGYSKVSTLKSKCTRYKNEAVRADVKENLWCQRGCGNETISIEAAIPLSQEGRSLLVCKAVDRITDESHPKWFLAHFYATNTSAKRSQTSEMSHSRIYLSDGSIRGVQVFSPDLSVKGVVQYLNEIGLKKEAVKFLAENCGMGFLLAA